MTIFPWYHSEDIGEVLRSMTQKHITEEDVLRVLKVVEIQVRDSYLTYNLANIVHDWKYLENTQVQ